MDLIIVIFCGFNVKLETKIFIISLDSLRLLILDDVSKEPFLSCFFSRLSQIEDCFLVIAFGLVADRTRFPDI